jgi:hypothetical protein
MKLMARKTASNNELRRNQREIDRGRAQPMRNAFPAVGMLRIELNFHDQRARAPSAQQHTLFPPAQAFFRFACPCSECDGEFDLTPAVTALLAGSARKPRNVTNSVRCQGVRLHGHPNSQACSIELRYQLASGETEAA